MAGQTRCCPLNLWPGNIGGKGLTADTAIEARDAVKAFGQGSTAVRALDNVSVIMMQLMPIIQNNDRQNIRIGNPALQPEFINLAEMNFNKIFGSNNWLASAYFMLETNTIKPFARASATDPTVLITTFLNAKNETRYGLDNTMKFALTKQIDLMTNLNVYNLSISTDSTLTQAWAYDVKAILNVKLPKSVSVQMSGNYQSNRVLPQGIRKGVPSMDLAVKKSFFGGAANITFTVSDVFNSRREILAYDFPQFYQENMRRRDLRFFRLSFQVPFGKADASIFKKAKEGSRRQQGQGEMDFGS